MYISNQVDKETRDRPTALSFKLNDPDKELTEKESRYLLDFLYTHVEDPLYQMRFRWDPHSVAFWDNRCTQHLAIWDYYPQLRSGYRVQLGETNPN